MTSYDSWHKRKPKVAEGPFGGYSLRDFLVQRPFHAALLLPWPLLMLPLLLLPTSWVVHLFGGSVATAVAGVVPMVKRMAGASANPEWVATILSLLWITGPVFTAATVFLCVRSHRAGVYQVPKASPWDVAFGLAVTLGALVLLAFLGPRAGKRVDIVAFVFANPLGLLLAGWFFFSSLFTALGLVIANPVIRIFGKKYE